LLKRVAADAERRGAADRIVRAAAVETPTAIAEQRGDEQHTRQARQSHARTSVPPALFCRATTAEIRVRESLDSLYSVFYVARDQQHRGAIPSTHPQGGARSTPMKVQKSIWASQFAALMILVGVGGACAHKQDKPDEPEKPAVAIPVDSPLAQIKPDMPEAEVIKILGQPTSTNSYIGGKAFNPFNFGGDSGAMLEAHYKGLGRIVYNIQRYSAERKVDNVQYDPAETGTNK
jgi:hypothetical protein